MIPNFNGNVNNKGRFVRPRGMTAAQIAAKYPLYSSEYTELWVCSKKSDLVDYLLDRKIYPQECTIEGNQHVAVFYLDKYFESVKAIALYNDLVARFMLAMPHEFRVNFKSFKRYDEKNPVQVTQAWQYQNLPSIPFIPAFAPKFNDDHYFHDKTFWALKYYFEELIRQNRYTYYALERYAVANFKDKCKDFSTLKCKCRNIYNWYMDRNFRLYEYKKMDDEERKEIYVENARKLNIERIKKTDDKLSLVFKNFKKYQRSDGTWDVEKISKKTGVSKKTIYRRLKEVKNGN